MANSIVPDNLGACRAGSPNPASIVPERAKQRRDSAIPPYSFNLPARAAAALVRLYQLTLSPALVALNPACGCRFSPSCSHYARTAFVEHGLVAGAFLTVRRLVRCGPWHPGGVDLVPLSSRRRLTCRAVAPARLLVPPASPLS